MTTQVVPTDEELGRFARQQHDWFERVRKGSLDPEAVVRAVHTIIDRMYPAEGEEFELTLDFDSLEADPIQMVRADGYGSPEKWEFTGKKTTGIQTRRFKLVSIGYQPNFKAVTEKLKKYGDIPEGQWRQAFKTAYPQADGKGPVGFADASWVSPFGSVFFPCVYTAGVSDFYWAGDYFYDVWRWLVLASK